MAIHDDLEVKILETTGAWSIELQEYRDTKNDGEVVSEALGVITRYIQAESGNMFKISILVWETFQMASDILGLEVYLDGRYMNQHLLSKDDLKPGSSGTQTLVEGVDRLKEQGWTMRRFYFREIKPGIPCPTNVLSVH